MAKRRNKKRNFSWKDYFFHAIFFFFYGLVKYLPSPLGDLLRYFMVKAVCREIGRVRIYEGVTFWYPYRMSLGNHVTLNEWVYLSGFGGLEIGDNVRIGHRTTVLTSDHIYSNIAEPMFKQGVTGAQVKIYSDVIIGANVTILKGVTIGRGAVVGAGAVVTKDVKSYDIVSGSPAKKLRSRQTS